MHHLPPELLAEIFMHFCELVIQRLLFTNPIPTLEKTITCVCKRWRQIAYGTPQLWIYLVSPKQNIKAYLERYVPLAKDCLLDVHGPSDADMLPAFMTEIRPYAAQLRSVTLFGSPADFNWLAPYDMPNLEYARILCCADWVEDPSARIAFIKDMPRLQSLYLFLGSLSADVVRFPPMPALTTLVINVSGAAPEILRPLQQCRQTLTTLRVAISPNQEAPGAAPPESAPPPLELPALRGLELEFDAERLLRYITAPALETLQLSGRDAGAPELLLDYLRRAPSTATRLRTLDVEHYQVERWPSAALEALVECLAFLEGLEILRFRSFLPPKELLQRLTGGEDTLPLLPKLKLGIFGREPRSGARPSKAYKALVRSRATSRSVGGIVVPAALITDSYLLRGKPVQCPH